LSRLISYPHASWSATAAIPAGLAETLERGAVIVLPKLAFEVHTSEHDIFSPSILSSSKNASYDPATDRVGGTSLRGDSRERLRDIIRRFSESADGLVKALLPEYGSRIVRRRASFRPAEIEGRHTSWRKDDTRLHLDAFPTSPTQGGRILRVFANVNPDGRPRRWRVGEDAAPIVDRFAARVSLPWPGVNWLLAACRVTKSRRSAYDSLMLQLHDRMKEDADYQRTSPQEQVDLPAGATWLTFTDQVSHAAMAGQYQFEQTFLLPVSAMRDESRSPLRVLERAKGRRLA
jgi:hypothetical protein